MNSTPLVARLLLVHSIAVIGLPVLFTIVFFADNMSAFSWQSSGGGTDPTEFAGLQVLYPFTTSFPVHSIMLGSSMDAARVSELCHFHFLFDGIFCLQSINQSIKLLLCQYPRRSQAQWHDSQIGVQQQNRWKSSVTSTGMPLSMGERPSQRCFFRCFLKVGTEMAERTDSGRLFQRDGAQEWKALAPVLVLTLGTDRLLSLFDLSEQGGGDVASMEWR